MKKRTDDNSEKGMMSVEVILSFTLFVVVIATLIYFINIFLVHNKIQYAINSAAHEISGYSYFYEAFGFRAASQKVNKDWQSDGDNIDNTVTSIVDSIGSISDTYDTVTEEVDNLGDTASQLNTYGNELINGDYEALSSEDFSSIDWDGLSSGIGNIENSAEGTVDQLKSTGTQIVNLCKNPKGILAGIIALGLQEGESDLKCLLGAVIAKTLTESFLENGDQSADEFLKSHGVVDGYDGLDFSKSSIFNDTDQNGGSIDKGEKYIDIVVQYKINLGILGMAPKALIDDPNITITQRVTVAAWMGGDDNHVPDALAGD